MVPSVFYTYFAAASAAAGALIGLLFVAISLRPETVFGDAAPPGGRALAGSTFTALVNAFFVSVLALIPKANLGDIAIVMALISLAGTARLHHRVGRRDLHLVLLAMSIAAYVTQLVVGVQLVRSPGDGQLVGLIAYVTVGSFAVALGRAWALVQGRHVQPEAVERAPEGAIAQR